MLPRPPFRNAYDLKDGRTIFLLTPARFAALPIGSKVISITGRTKVVGADRIDTNTKNGYMLFGVE